VTESGARRKRLPCACCGAHTIEERCVYEICPRCGWEDDPVQAADPGYRGGANAQSLNEARAAWAARAN
jgi:anaerobic ribonucleoside-triphosphate reductase